MAKAKKVYSDPLLRKDSRGVFNLYRNRNDIGNELTKSFIEYDLNKRSDGFLINEAMPTAGMISQCYGLLTIMEYVKFDIDIENYADVCSKINVVFNDILSRVYSRDDETLVFDATPYVNDANIKQYIESAALFLRVLIEVRGVLCNDYDKNRNVLEINSEFVEYSEEGGAQERTLAEIRFVEKLISKTICFINDSALLANGEEGVDYYLDGSDTPLLDADGLNVKYKGWTFTQIPADKHSKTEMSLIHTYLVCDAYLSFYEFFPKSIDLIRKLRNAISSKLIEEGRATHDGYLDMSIDEFSDIIKDANLSDYGLEIDNDDIQFQRDFEYVRSIYKIFHKFNKVIVDSGHYVDTQFAKNDTTRYFFNHNFKQVTSEDIENSSASDAMFNVLFAINIMMAAGVDLDYKDNDLMGEYYDKLQYSIPNVQRFYKKLTRDGKGDMFDKYILKLSNAIPTDDQDSEGSVYNQAKEIRKQHIVMLGLSPLIIKTYCIVSKYLIPYPQYDMRTYKNEIIQKKMPNTWLWDDEEYNLINNYNYVYALRLFYDYYEIYERPYSLDKAKYIEEKEAEIAKLNEAIKDQKDSFKEKLAQAQREKQLTIQDYEEILVSEREKYDKKKAPIEKEIESIVNNAMEKSVTEILRRTLKDIIAENGRKVNDSESTTLLFKHAITSYLRDAYTAATEIFDSTSDIDEDIPQDLLEEAIAALVQDKIRSNKS